MRKTGIESARDRFGDLVNHAQYGGEVTIITRRGRPAAAVVPLDRVAPDPSATAFRSRHQSRPGRHAIVITDLGTLRGPASGIVELPQRLFWSSPDKWFDLGDHDMLLWMYENVLREAIDSAELTTYLNGETLAAVWHELALPEGVRRAWEEAHPALRATKAA